MTLSKFSQSDDTIEHSLLAGPFVGAAAGALGASAATETALVLAAINGPDVDDSCSVEMPFNFDAGKGVKGLRIGLIPGAASGPAHKKSVEVLKALGCEMVEFALPEWPYDCLMNILECEAAAAFEELTRTQRDDLLTSQGPGAWPNTRAKASRKPLSDSKPASRPVSRVRAPPCSAFIAVPRRQAR